MKAVVTLILIWFSTAVHAETIVVRSGEHADFTRLVFSWTESKEWTLTKTQEGYDLVFLGGSIQYDLSSAFKRITNKRIADMFAKSETLHLVLSCQCLATPVDLDDNLLVIDIGSSAGPKENPHALDVLIRPIPNPNVAGNPSHEIIRVDNKNESQLQAEIAEAVSEAARHSPTQASSSILASVSSIDHMKNELLMQISRGVASGVVSTDNKLHKPVQANIAASPSNNIRVHSEMGITAGAERQRKGDMTVSGTACIPDSRVNIGDWAKFPIIVSEIADNTTGLVGEFDRPEPKAISKAVRYYLSIGFGAEARQLAAAFDDSDPEHAILETLSYIVDLDLPPGTQFSGMESCDSSAAIWAVLAKKDLSSLNHISLPAVIRNFSALPIHLRRLLGPGLAERFLEIEEYPTALAIRDATLRTAQQRGPSQELLDAQYEFATGDLASAETQLSRLAGTSGLEGVAATIALIRAQVGDGREVSVDLTTTAEALLQEVRGGEKEIEMQTALALAYASQNRFSEAFTQVDKSSIEAEPIWRILADRGSDDAILSKAILQPEQERPPASANSATKIGRRLLDLGFPKQALLWLDMARGQNEANQIMSAEAQLLLNNNLEALSLLEGTEGSDSAKLKALALAKLQTSDAINRLSQSGQEREASSAAKQKRNWPELLLVEKSMLWQKAAALVGTSTSSADNYTEAKTEQGDKTKGQLAATRDTLTESASAREILNKLLLSQSIPE